MIDKGQMRKAVKDKLSGIPSEERNIASEAIASRLISLPEFAAAESVFIYISFSTEAETAGLIKQAVNAGKKVYVPVVDGPDMLMSGISADTIFVRNKFGILEPRGRSKIYEGDIDFAVIPLIAFDRKLNRLGRGKGFYDKFLNGRKCFKAALAFSAQELPEVLVEPHDIRVNVIVTEKEVIR